MKIPLNEISRDELIANASPEPWKDKIEDRSRDYSTKFIGVKMDEVKNLCALVFNVSALGHGSYYVYINLDTFWERYRKIEEKDNLQKLILNIIKSGDIKLYCTCPHFIYGGYAYISTKKGYNFGKSVNIPPSVRNPKEKGTMCKHCYRAIKYLPNNTFTIARAIKAQLDKEASTHNEEGNE